MDIRFNHFLFTYFLASWFFFIFEHVCLFFTYFSTSTRGRSMKVASISHVRIIMPKTATKDHRTLGQNAERGERRTCGTGSPVFLCFSIWIWNRICSRSRVWRTFAQKVRGWATEPCQRNANEIQLTIKHSNVWVDRQQLSPMPPHKKHKKNKTRKYSHGAEATK